MYLEGLIALFVNHDNMVIATVHIINAVNLPLKDFKDITAMCAPSRMAINSFWGMDHASACRGTTQLLAIINEVLLSFTMYATA